MRLLFSIGLFLLFLNSAQSAPQFTKCAQTIRSLITPQHDTSVELEIKNSDGVLSLLTTTDGTLAPLLPPKPGFSILGFRLPPALDESFKGWSYEQVAKEPWDNLTISQKEYFLTWVSARKKTDFFKDRKVPGFKIKDKATLTFSKPTEFLGKTYEPGTHEIDISHLFRQVEYGNPSQNPSMLELHFRTKNPSGEVSVGAWTFLSGLNQPKIHQHVHIVNTLNIKQLQEEGRVRSVMIADLYRRANLILEMMVIVEEKHRGLRAHTSGDIIFWDTLSSNNLDWVYKHLEKTRKTGKQPHLGSAAKMAYVGFRGADTYDDPSLFGFEVRGISRFANEEFTKKYLNTLQWAMAQENYGIPKESMEKWIKQNNENPQFKFGSTWYNQPWEELKTNGFAHRFEEIIDPFLRKNFYNLEENRELKMLLHDWSNDPLLFQNKKLIDQIREKQIQALSRLNAGRDSQQKIVSDFLIQSGLYGIFTRSLGQ